MTRVALGVAAAVAGLSGCASPAKEISFDPQTGSGVVAIPSNTDAWPTYNYTHAKELIQKRVGPNFEVVEEGQVVTGQQTVNNQQVTGDLAWGATTTSDVTEWRIAYRKRPGAAAAGGPLMPGMQPVQQTQYPPGKGAAAAAVGSGVHPAGGIVPSAAPGGGVIRAGGTVPGGKANCNE